MNSNSPHNFAPTRWTLVLRARDGSSEAHVALGDLCAAYYQPVFHFLLRSGRNEDAARELTQEFFTRVLAHGSIGSADPKRGRFRSYLLGAVKHFLADRRDYERREKRGGGHQLESIDAEQGDTPALQIADPSTEPDDAIFDRAWALAVMERALNALASEFQNDGKSDQFTILKPWLAGDAELLPQGEAAMRLGLSETAVKVAIHRLRKRFREMIRAEISQTVDMEGNVDQELSYLVEVLARR